MKKLFTFMVAVFLTATLWAQSPEKMSYQAVIRNSSEALVTNTTVGMQISILQGSASGTAVYVETQSPTTNANGLISIKIGDGTVQSGDFTNIEWANGPYFIKTETDPAGGTDYTITGTSQLLSVPYALHAKTAESVTGGITESDPTFTSSQAANINATDITNLSNLSGVNTGDQDLSALATKTALGDSTAQVRSEIPDVSGFLTSETDPTFTSSQAANINATDITNLSNLSGVNTGDQDLSALATKTALGDSTAQVRSEIPDVSGFLTSETDPTFTSSQAANINATDITNLSNLSGVNTGDQDLSALATKTALGDSTAQVRSEIPDVSGFLTSETDPTFTSSQAANITATDITNLGNLSGVNTGDQDLSTLATKTALGDSTAQVRSEIPDVSGFLTSETDPTFTSSQAANINATDITNLSNLSGVNTGDQDLSALATKTALGDSTAQVRSEIPDVSGFLTTETDPTFTSSQAANITATDITNLGNLSGVNTGDQDLSTLATKTALGDSTAQVRSEIPDVSGFFTTETDPTFTSSQAANITATDITNLGNLSGVNTGDQDLSTLATKTALGDSTAQVRSEIPDVSGFLTSETDPTFTSSQAANITATDITNLGNLSGVNTGDQDLSTLATKTALGDSTAQVRSEIPDVSGFLTSETDPTFTSSQAANINATDITNLSNLSGVNTGDQDLSALATKTALGDSTAQVRSEIPDVSGFLTSETDPTFTSSQAANINATDITNLSNLSGVNTGDQDLSALATKTALGDSTAQVRSEIPDVSGFLTSETDPTFTSSQAANINATDITNLSNLSGVNTGDQDLSALATKTALGDSTAQVRSEIPDVSGFLTTETDPTFTSSQAANITATDITNLSNLSGSNTGDQTLATILTASTDADGKTISNLAAPTAAMDAATKAYVDALEAKLTFLELKVDLSAGASVSDLIAAGASVSDLVAAGASVSDLVAAGASVSDLVAAGASVSDLVAAGASVSDLVAAGTSVSDLVAAGASVSDLVAAGATNESDYIGLTYQGGIIFYVDVNGTGTGIGTGLIASTADQSTGIQWYNGDSFTITGATATALGTGNTNTNTIVTSLGTGSYAAQLCADLSEGGYDDWYLPSKDELNKLYLNRTAVGGFASAASAYYWSSTEYDKHYAWRQNLDYGYQNTNVVKNGTLRVRAVRAF